MAGAIRARISLLLIALSFLAASAPAGAAVRVSFYSKEWGTTFPHAFIRLEGTVDSTGEAVDTNFGFTTKTISPAVLLGSVTGKIMTAPADYVAKSDRHFSFMLSDGEYKILLGEVERWRDLKQPSYNLNRRNCVFFIADVAALLGMKADTPKELMKKPRSYIQSLLRANREWLEKRAASMPA
jgi:hypothetical protein